MGNSQPTRLFESREIGSDSIECSDLLNCDEKSQSAPIIRFLLMGDDSQVLDVVSEGLSVSGSDFSSGNNRFRINHATPFNPHSITHKYPELLNSKTPTLRNRNQSSGSKPYFSEEQYRTNGFLTDICLGNEYPEPNIMVSRMNTPISQERKPDGFHLGPYGSEEIVNSRGLVIFLRLSHENEWFLVELDKFLCESLGYPCDRPQSQMHPVHRKFEVFLVLYDDESFNDKLKGMAVQLRKTLFDTRYINATCIYKNRSQIPEIGEDCIKLLTDLCKK